MRSKALYLISFLTILLLSYLFYVNFFNKEIFYYNYVASEKIKVFEKYNDNIVFYYGNVHRNKIISHKTKGKVNTNKVGKYEITYTAKVKKKITKLKKVVEVIDDIKPTLNITGDFNNVCPNGKINYTLYNALDNYDGDITKKIEQNIDLKNKKVIYKVSDSSLNSIEKDVEISINDKDKPKITLNGNKTLYITIGGAFKEPGYIAQDNCDGDITKKVIVTNNIDLNKAGTYTITYKVSDSASNDITITREVKVLNNVSNTYSTETGPKIIYLTFDDGPSKHTERLLNILKKYNVKATFFVSGYNNGYNQMITREYNEGHSIGLHSYSHDYKSIYSSVDNFMNDLNRIEAKVKQYAGINTKILRFPGGSSNTVSKKYNRGIMSELSFKLEQMGYRYFDWTITSGDAGNTTNSNVIYNNVVRSISPNGKNVVLMHDTKSYTVDSVERIIQYGINNGYTFAPLTMQSPVVHQRINN